MDTLSHHPYVPQELYTDSESEEYETTSYAMVCEELEVIIDEEKLSIECKVAIQNKENKPAQQEPELHSGVIEVLSKVSPCEMKEAQQADPTIIHVVQWVKAGNKQKLPQIIKEKSKNVMKYLCQFDHLEFRKGVFHQIYEVQESMYHQLVLTKVYRAQVLQLVHEDQCHQRIEHTLALTRETFFWSMMCHEAKGPYNDLNVKQGSLVANRPSDLLCLDFTKMDCSKDGKGNILVMIYAFSNFTVAVVTSNEQAK